MIAIRNEVSCVVVNIAKSSPCRRQDFPSQQLLNERGIDVDHLFTQRYSSLDEATAAYELFDTQTTGKGVFLL